MPLTQEEHDLILAEVEDGLHLVPSHMHGGIKRYTLQGIPPGSFLEALLSNDLMGAFRRADDENQRAMFGWACFLYNHVPSECYGSPEKYRAWCRKAGPELEEEQ